MPEPQLPDEVRALIESLARDSQAAWNRIKADEARLLQEWPDQRRPVRIQRLAEMDRNVTQITRGLNEVLIGTVPEATTMAYELGAWGAALKVDELPAFTAVDMNAASIIARDTMDDLLSATRYVQESTKDLIQQMAREQILAATYTGLTAEQAGIRLAADLQGHGIHSIVYANGAKVALPSYTDMVLRTKTAIAMQEGGFQQGERLGIEWYEIMDGPDCGLDSHDSRPIADGQIVTREVAERYPISHPNCVRVSSPRPDIFSPEEAEVATRTATDEQVADQNAASRARAEAYERNPRRYGLQRQVNRELALRGDYEAASTRAASPAVARQARRVEKPAPHTAEQMAAHILEQAHAIEPELTEMMRRLAEVHDVELGGLDHRVKGIDSLTRKIQADMLEKGLTAAEVGDALFDVNRYTMVVYEDRYAEVAQMVLEQLQAEGATMNVKNFWLVHDNPYKGINVQVQRASGERFELQFHTPRSLEVKNGPLHELYELQRVTTDPEMIAVYDSRMFTAASRIMAPRDVDRIGLLDWAELPTPRLQQVSSLPQGRSPASIFSDASLYKYSHQMPSVRPDVSPSWAHAITEYTTGQDQVVNRDLRAGTPLTGRPKEIHETLSSMMTKTPEDAITYRKVRFTEPELKKLFGVPEASGIEQLVGASFLDPGYQSTAMRGHTILPGEFGNVVMRVFLPKGTRGIGLSEISGYTAEQEFLLDRGTKITIVRATRGPGSEVLLDVVATQQRR